MNDILYSFIVSTMAGFSTLLGALLIFYKGSQNKIILSSLAFAAGVMICVSITDLIPSSFVLISGTFKEIFALLLLALFFTIGVIFSGTIDKYIPSEGNNNMSSLYKVGIFSMIAIILHNIPEGILTFLSSSSNKELGLSLAIAISFHNIPEGISIAIPIYYSTKSKKKAFLYTFISGISEPFGAILAYIFLANIMNDLIMGFLFAFTAGIMIQISSYELLPSSIKYNNKKRTLLFFIIGFIFMITSHILLG